MRGVQNHPAGLRRAARWPQLPLRPLTFTALSAIVMVASLMSAFLLVDGSGSHLLSERERAPLVAMQAELRQAAVIGGLPAAVAAARSHVPHAARHQYLALWDAAGRQVAGNIRLGVPRPRPWSEVHVISVSGTPLRLEAAITALPGGGVILVGYDTSAQDAFRAALRDGLALALAICLSAGLGIGLLLHAMMMRRAAQIARISERMARGDFSGRLSCGGRADPFERIGRSLNAMAERLDELVTGLRTVTDSLAHDLRAPLARILASAEAASDPDLCASARQHRLAGLRRDAELALYTFGSLIDIARAEGGVSRDLMGSLRLDELAAEVLDTFEPVLAEAGQTAQLLVTPSLDVHGHAPLLRQALGNLILNASKYAGAGATVIVEAAQDGGRTRLVVADDGPGMPPELRDRPPTRFQRGPGEASVGLGLSIVAACAKLHDGALQLLDNGPGLRAVLTLGARGSGCATDAAPAEPARRRLAA